MGGGTLYFLGWRVAHFVPKQEFSLGFLCIILSSTEATTKLRWRGGGGIIVFRLQRSSEGCSVAQKGTA
jgi:hypothetical protein